MEEKEENMDKMTKKIIGVFVAILIVAAVILGGYFVLTKQAQKQAQEEVLPTTEIGKILAKDLETKYPETPTEVVKLYWRINSCMYNDSMSDEDFEKLLEKLRILYDEEFLAKEENSYDNMLKEFKKDKEARSKKEQSISTYNVQKNDTVEVKKLDDRECATIVASALITAKKDTTKIYEKFMCRKSEDGKWKILGWQSVDTETAEKVGVE